MADDKAKKQRNQQELTEKRVREIVREEIRKWHADRVINMPAEIKLGGLNHQ
jgi:hypothetical protein